MNIIKWMCFIIVCSDTLNYILECAEERTSIVGVFVGIAIRVYVLYNTATYWLLA